MEEGWRKDGGKMEVREKENVNKYVKRGMMDEKRNEKLKSL